MSIDSAITSAAGALILLSIFDTLNVWWGISSAIMVAVAIAGWWITQRIVEEGKADEK